MALDPAVTKRIRVLIPDAEPVFGDSGTEYMFSDDDIEAYYVEGFENAKCAAGLAKMAIGSSEALILKQVKNYETSTSGAALMREWVNAGEKLYDRGLAEIADADSDIGIFEIVYPDYGYLRDPEGETRRDELMGGWM
jgi:hypothetical protein